MNVLWGQGTFGRSQWRKTEEIAVGVQGESKFRDQNSRTNRTHRLQSKIIHDDFFGNYSFFHCQ